MKVRFDLMALHWEKDVDPQRVRELYMKRAGIKADMLLASIDYRSR
ncbi:MAG: hypothetical protein ACOCWR_03495 [Oceanidesulfovibrio sp.]